MSGGDVEIIDGSSSDYDVIVVGGGISGLTAARTITKAEPSLKVLVLEGKDRVGGRTLTVPIKASRDGATELFDLGGQWIGLTQLHALALLKELGIELYEQYVLGEKQIQAGNSLIRSYYETLPIYAFRTYSLGEIADFAQAMIKHTFLEKKVDILDPYAWEGAVDADSNTIESWASSNTWSRTTRDTFEVVARSLYGMPANRISMLYHLMYSKSAGGIFDLVEASGNGAQAFRIKGGAQQISQRMASDLGQAVRLGEQVTAVETNEEQTTITLESGEVLSCHRCILAIPPNQCARLEWSPPLPLPKRRLFDEAATGMYTKFVATFVAPFWRKEGKSGEIVSAGRTDTPGETRAVIVAYDATTHNGVAAIVGFINFELHDLTKEQRQAAVLQDLTCFLGGSVEANFVAYEEKKWADEPLNGGCPVDILAPGLGFAALAIRDVHGAVHFAATETATVWTGYMDGAVQAGKRAAHEVLLAFNSPRVDHKCLTDSTFPAKSPKPCKPQLHYRKRLFSWTRVGISVAVAAALAYFVTVRMPSESPVARAIQSIETTAQRLFNRNR